MPSVGHPWDDPLAVAAARALAAGWRGCPLAYLDDFVSERWGFDELCADLGCAECRGLPEEGPGEPVGPVGGEEDREEDIPF